MSTFAPGEIDAALQEADGDVDVAYAKLWRAKADEYASLVDMSEGSSRRQLSQLFKHAQEQLEYYDGRVAAAAEVAGTARRTRIRSIVRE